MGRTFVIVFLNRFDDKVRAWLDPSLCDDWCALTSFSYSGSATMGILEHLLSPDGNWYRSRVSCSGGSHAGTLKAAVSRIDDEAYESGVNDFRQFRPNRKMIEKWMPPQQAGSAPYRYPYIVNHSRREYVDVRKSLEAESLDKSDEEAQQCAKGNPRYYMLHPMPILVADDGGDRVNGDVNNVYMGRWAREEVSFESDCPPKAAEEGEELSPVFFVEIKCRFWVDA